MKTTCLVCTRIDAIKAGTNPYFVAELESGYIVLCDFQEYEGYTLFLSKFHISELHQLDQKSKLRFLEDTSQVGEAVFTAFQADKINYELLGNSEKDHLHWHIIPRKTTDPGPQGPIWLRGKEAIYAEESRPISAKLEQLKAQLRNELG